MTTKRWTSQIMTSHSQTIFFFYFDSTNNHRFLPCLSRLSLLWILTYYNVPVPMFHNYRDHDNEPRHLQVLWWIIALTFFLVQPSSGCFHNIHVLSWSCSSIVIYCEATEKLRPCLNNATFYIQPGSFDNAHLIQHACTNIKVTIRV